MTATLAHREPAAVAPPSAVAASFLRGLLARASLLVFAAACLNYLVNPFGAYATRLFDPIALGTRGPKLSLYRLRRPAPAIVVLGSSRGFTLEPAYVEARTSRPAFNAAVHAGMPRDYLALARCFAAEGRFPALLIVGLGVEQMLREGRAVERLDPLASCQPGEASAAGVLRRHRGLLTLEETWASLRVLGLELTGRPAPLYSFDPDGMVRGGAPRPLERAVAESLAGNWRPGIFDVPALDPGVVGHVRGLLELSRDRGARVIVYLPPFHPTALARYQDESNFPALRARLLEQLAAWAHQFPLIFHDFTEPASFGGRADMFYDASHPREDAYRLMLDAMLSDLG